MAEVLNATHGVICSLGTDFFGYFGWPSVARMDDGKLVAVASGLRNAHVCPFGRTTMMKSHDNGQTWSSPRVINDSPCDDRDAGILSLGANRLLISWFTSDNRESMIKRMQDPDDSTATAAWQGGIDWITDESAQRFCGAWIRTSDDGGDTWHEPVRVPVNTPHGPILLSNGKLLYYGKEFGMSPEERKQGEVIGRILAMESTDPESGWTELGESPIYPGTDFGNYHEPHVVELPDGRLISHIRVQNHGDKNVVDAGLTHFSMMQSESNDGGKSWTTMRPLGFHGSPPHLMRHSTGTLICTYGYRNEPYGERVALSSDDGKTWQHDYVLRDDGPDGDLGYPASVELEDGSLFTVYYQKEKPGNQCGLLSSRWKLP